jgi:hypothetical protein
MTDTPPDRLSNNPRSPHYKPEHLQRGIGIRFNGVEKTNVDEYCVSEGWVKMAIGKTVDRKGNPLTITAKGVVEPRYLSADPDAPAGDMPDPASVDGDA